MVGLAVAIIVLLVAFGSVIAAGIPIGSALFGIMIGLGLIGVMSGFTDVPSISPMLATMIGLGVGIDYALFVVTRHRGFMHEGRSPVESAALANATSGTAVLFAGTTVVVALAGLSLAGIPSIAVMGYASAVTVLVAMLGAVTLLPAFLGLAGSKIDRLHIGRRRSEAEVAAHTTVSGRWADHVGRHPWRYAIGSFVVLTAIAAPVLSMRTGMADDGTAASDKTYRKAYDLLADGFGPGFNGPLTIALEGADGATVDPAVADDVRVVGRRDRRDRVRHRAGVQPGVGHGRGDRLPGDVAAGAGDRGAGPHAARRRAARRRCAGSDVDAYVTGQTASYIDISEKLASRLPIFIAAVVGVSFLLLMLVFRSVVVPFKAAIMNLLSIGAAYGVVVAVFQWGWGNGLIGVDETVPVSPFLPMIMFAILFGLSMDYEVFLLSRVREEFVRTGDSHQSVVDGLAATARVITSAALIMISVFAAFLLSPDVEVKMFAVGLTVAVFVDATIVRMILVPSTMALMGDANWWLPRWLDRAMPHIDVEGASVIEDARGGSPRRRQRARRRRPRAGRRLTTPESRLRRRNPFWAADPCGGRKKWQPRWTGDDGQRACGVITRVWTARPTAPCSSNSNESAIPIPDGSHRDTVDEPSQSPIGSRCRTIVRSGLTNVYSVVSPLRENALPQSASGQMRWNGDGFSSPSKGTVRIQAVVGPPPGPLPGG